MVATGHLHQVTRSQLKKTQLRPPEDPEKKAREDQAERDKKAEEERKAEQERKAAIKQQRETWWYSQMHDAKPSIQATSKNIWNTVGDPVDIGTGAFCLETVDLQIGNAVPITLKRSYNSKAPVMGIFGFGWRHNFPTNLVISEKDGISIIYAPEPDGSIVAYSKKPGETLWRIDPALNPELEIDPQAWASFPWATACIEYLDQDGPPRYNHNTAQGSVRIYTIKEIVVQDQTLQRPCLTAIWDPSDNPVWFVYDDQSQINGEHNSHYGRIVKIHNNYGDSIALSYTPLGLIQEAKSSDGRIVKYEYDAHGDLIKVRYPDDSEVEYSYQHDGTSSKHYLTQERKPENRVLENTYDADGRVLEQKANARCVAEKQTQAVFEYGFIGDPNEGKTFTRLSDPHGQRTEYRFYKGRLYKIIDPLGQVIETTWYIDASTIFDPSEEALKASDVPGKPAYLKQTKSKRGLVHSYEYNSNGQWVQVTIKGQELTGTGISEHKIYREYQNSYPFGLTKEWFKNTDGNVHGTTYTYDETYKSYPKQIIHSINDVALSRTELIYGKDKHNKGKPICETLYDAQGTLLRQIESDYTEAGHLKATHQRIDGTGAKYTIHYTYNEAGLCTEERHPSGDRVTQSYDKMHRKTAETYLSENGQKLHEQTYTYNKSGERE